MPAIIVNEGYYCRAKLSFHSFTLSQLTFLSFIVTVNEGYYCRDKLSPLSFTKRKDIIVALSFLLSLLLYCNRPSSLLTNLPLFYYGACPISFAILDLRELSFISTTLKTDSQFLKRRNPKVNTLDKIKVSAHNSIERCEY